MFQNVQMFTVIQVLEICTIQSLWLTITHCIFKIVLKGQILCWIVSQQKEKKAKNRAGGRKFLKVMDKLTTLIVFMASRVYTFSKHIRLYTLNISNFLYVNQTPVKHIRKKIKAKTNAKKWWSFEVLAETLRTRVKIRYGKESNVQTKMWG